MGKAHFVGSMLCCMMKDYYLLLKSSVKCSDFNKPFTEYWCFSVGNTSYQDFMTILLGIAEGLQLDSRPLGLRSQPLGCGMRRVDFQRPGMTETVQVLSLVQNPCLFPQSHLNSAGSA